MKIDIKKYLLPIGFLAIALVLYSYDKDLIGGFVFLVCGIGFLFGGFYLRNTNQRIETKGIKTKAKIIDFVEEKREGSGDYYSHTYHFPIVQFKDKRGIETTQKLDSSANPKRINQTIDIIYLKKDSKYEIMINSDFWKSYFLMIFIIGGLLFLGIGIALLIKEI